MNVTTKDKFLILPAEAWIAQDISDGVGFNFLEKKNYWEAGSPTQKKNFVREDWF